MLAEGEFTVTTVGSDNADAQPFSSTLLTVYDPGRVTMMLGVVAPVLHILPVESLEVRTTLPPSHIVVVPFAVIVGVSGTSIGAATALAGLLVHPFGIVCVTVYVPGTVTVIKGVDVLGCIHNSVPP